MTNKPTDAEKIAWLNTILNRPQKVNFTHSRCDNRGMAYAIRDRLASLTPTNNLKKFGALLIEAEQSQATAAENGYKAGWNAAIDTATQQLGASVDIVTTLDKLRKL